MAGNRLSPIQDRRYHSRVEVVESDIVFHQIKHGYLICNVDGFANFTPTSNRKSNETTSSSQFHATRYISGQFPGGCRIDAEETDGEPHSFSLERVEAVWEGGIPTLISQTCSSSVVTVGI